VDYVCFRPGIVVTIVSGVQPISLFFSKGNMTNKYDFEEEDEDEDDGFTKDRRKRRIKNNKKFKRHKALGPKKIKGFIQDKPRKRNWRELIDDEDDNGDAEED
jgi:hypothetical protein